MSHSLNQLYRAIGISKQALHQRLDRELKEQSYQHQLLFLIHELRENHPTMGARDMYFLLKPIWMGRDKFEAFCKDHGLFSKRVLNYRRTTDSSGVIRFPNLTVGLELNRINQLWVSDITYYELNNLFYYLTFILDAFSRRILGYHVSRRLYTTQTTLPAFRMAIKTREGIDLSGTIFLSDGGGQYYDKEFLNLTLELKIKNSMCEYPWENGKAERINGVIKNNYLKHRNINNFEELQKEVDRAVKLYNNEKPHSSLKRLSPIMFEKKYFYNGKTTDGEKSTTGKRTHTVGQQSYGLWGKQPQA